MLQESKKELKAKLSFDDWIDLYLQIMNGIKGIHLSDSEISLVKSFINKYFELKKTISSDGQVFEVLFSTKSRKQIRLALDTNIHVFNNRLHSLKAKGVILNKGTDKEPIYILNSKLLPVKELIFKFEINE